MSIVHFEDQGAMFKRPFRFLPYCPKCNAELSPKETPCHKCREVIAWIDPYCDEPAESATPPREDVLAKLVMDLREMHGMTVCGEAWQELELDSEQMAAEIERYVESRQKTVPMAMLRDAWNNGEICKDEYQREILLEIAARYGYKVEDTP